MITHFIARLKTFSAIMNSSTVATWEHSSATVTISTQIIDRSAEKATDTSQTLFEQLGSSVWLWSRQAQWCCLTALTSLESGTKSFETLHGRLFCQCKAVFPECNAIEVNTRSSKFLQSRRFLDKGASPRVTFSRRSTFSTYLWAILRRNVVRESPKRSLTT